MRLLCQHPVLVSYGCYNKLPQPGDLMQQKFTFYSVWYQITVIKPSCWQGHNLEKYKILKKFVI